MVLAGHGHQLYDAPLQRQYQAHYAGGVGTLYSHPPFEAVLYFVVAWLPMRQAYLLWFALSLAALIFAVRSLNAEVIPRWDWSISLAASLTFVPVLLSLLQGQDSLVFLLLMILAFTALRGERAFAAGCWLGLALCKFQIVLPLVAVVLLGRSGRSKGEVVKGLSLVALMLAAFSASISGWRVFIEYPRFLLSQQTQSSSGVAPAMMANFRGLVDIFFHGEQSAWAIAAASILCACALIRVVTVWKRVQTISAGSASNSTHRNFDFDFAFVNATLFALLVSYYLNPHDLTLLLLPVFLALRVAWSPTPPMSRSMRRITMALLGILFLPPLHLWALSAHVYALIALPVFFLFLVSGFRLRRSNSSHAT